MPTRARTYIGIAKKAAALCVLLYIRALDILIDAVCPTPSLVIDHLDGHSLADLK